MQNKLEIDVSFNLEELEVLRAGWAGRYLYEGGKHQSGYSNRDLVFDAWKEYEFFCFCEPIYREVKQQCNYSVSCLMLNSLEGCVRAAARESILCEGSYKYNSWEPGYDSRADVSLVTVKRNQLCGHYFPSKYEYWGEREVEVFRVRLTMLDVYIAEKMALYRRYQSKKTGNKDNQGLSKLKGLETDMIGAVGEQVFSKAEDIINPWFWYEHKKADFGIVDVKACYEFSGRLLVEFNDRDDLIFVPVRPVIGAERWTWETRYQMLDWDIVGWVLGKSAKVDHHPGTGRKGSTASCVDDKYLHPILTLSRQAYE